MKRLLLSALLMLMPLAAHAQDRVLPLGGTVTEIIYQLGEQQRLIGRDTTSTWPAEAVALPDVGYVRALSPEGVLSVSPDLILMEEGAGPAETIEALRGAGVRMVTVPDDYTPEGVAQKVRVVADALGVPDKGADLAARIEADIAAARARVAEDHGPKPRVLFVLANSGGRLTGGGAQTAAAAIIGLAGGENAVTGFTGYKTLSDEAIATAAPDIILMMDRGDGSDDTAGLLAHPALAHTPAGERGAVVRLSGLLLLGFGPRTGAAIDMLHSTLAAHRAP
ncbi:hemin ABC transporter substrate-binding protein [Sinirhodobacter populi]|uniref:Hemin ABC transporter substrate-binding protein n=1 Tax=Paenirhodobacter populi TaxID=2306993 RepID=A0A443KNH1_9RHOB|nr:ABC transporter substrate-binding protein [Sinirhodobacter populi]RWR34411.1 hemin ABC transporter substrate-binding protein [Sinirhodobacter populi]